VRGLSVALAGLLWLSAMARAESPVYFPDAGLKQAVEDALGVSDPTPSDMLGLTSLIRYYMDIRDLTGLEYATNLRELSLSSNAITSLSPLSGLTGLQSLTMEDNRVSSLAPLSGLTNLGFLNMEANCISDLSPLLGLTSLRYLNVGENPLSDEAYETQIPQIAANNPGGYILHERRQFHFTISTTPGGTVVTPGVGDFIYDGRTDITVEAQADPGFVFAGFTGTYYCQESSFFISVDEDVDIRAHFVSTSTRLYVDDDAPNDPGPGNAAVSDPLEDGSRTHPFDKIQDAIEVAGQRVTIFVQAGTYHETIDLLGKQIELTGFDPNDPNEALWPVLDGSGNSPVVRFPRSGENCLLTGFVITGGKGQTGPALRCIGASPTISHCLIAGHRATDWDGAAILCTDSPATFVNCTIADNEGGEFPAGLSAVNSLVTVVNCVFWNNGPQDVTVEGDLLPVVRYSIVTGNWPGPGNLTTNPLFAGPGRWVDRNNPALPVPADDPRAVWSMGDYHVQSPAGRWEPATGTWVRDLLTSPCVDGGDPAGAVGPEPLPNGGTINIGVYGGTREASKSPGDGPVP
jgi:hypothetical protein